MSIHVPPTVLTFALSDPTGAAGVLADALTCASMGCHAACAITGVAVQDSTRVEDLLVLDDEWINDQARAVLQDMPVAAFKIGAVGNADNAQAIAEILADYPELPVVFDPFPAGGRTPAAASARGAPEADAYDVELLGAMRELLLPQTTVLTVNLTQARRLIAVAADDDAAEEYGSQECARRLLQWGAEHVLITSAEALGGHIVNRLFSDDGAVQNESIERVDLPFRGAGDTLSAGIAALLAQGIAPGDAVREANDFLGQALAAGFRLGMGDAVPDRLFWAGEDDDAADRDDAAEPT